MEIPGSEETVLCPEELIGISTISVPNMSSFSESGFTGVRYISRHDSEVSIEKDAESMSYLTINDDIDVASEADEESIASSLKDTTRFLFLKEQDGQTRTRSRRPDSETSTKRSLASVSTDGTPMDETLTYKVKKNELLPDPTLAVFEKVAAEPEGWSLEKFSKFMKEIIYKHQELPFFHYRLYSLAFLVVLWLILPGFIAGLLFGFYIAFVSFLFVSVSNPIRPQPRSTDDVVENIKELSSVENSLSRVYKGWMNILNEEYDPHTFHVNSLQTVLVRLDGNMLRISRPERALLKHAFHDDPTLSRREPTMMSQSIYDLSNATVKLRPKRLAKRRWFSRKYPICVILASGNSEIQSKNRFLSQSKTLENFSNDSTEEENGIFSKVFKKRKPSESASCSSGSPNNSDILETTVNDKENPNVERHTVGTVEMCKEADGYASELDGLENEINEIPKSHSAGNLRNNFSNKNSKKKEIFLFARSAREKERWYHRLRRACNRYGDIPKESKRKLSLPSGKTSPEDMTKDYLLYLLHNLQYSKHLDDILTDEVDKRSREEKGDEYCTVYMDLGRQKWIKPDQTTNHEFVIIANLLCSRIFYDFCRDAYWCEAVRHKIQTKLATIHLPYFIETLELSKLEFGTAIPKIERVYAPTVDDWGTWVDFDVKYDGCIRLVLETKVNLMKLKGSLDSIEENGSEVDRTFMTRSSPSRYSDEDIPESPETSPDEDFGSKMKLTEQGSKKKTGKRILYIVDKIAHSKYFKEASELKPIKKMMEEISSTRLVLNVEVTSLEGTCTLNLPPPPSDRLWYGFRKPPLMSVKGIPQVGDRSVVFSTISDWIESKIRLVLEKNLVVPNLDDIIIPVLSGNELLVGPLNL